MKNIKLYPCCRNFCRTWEETQGNKYPPSDHSPACKNYQQKEYRRIFLADDPGRGYVQEMWFPIPEDTGDGGGFGSEIILMTEDQFEKLDEFQGF